MLPPHARLRHSDDIGRVRQEGRRWTHPLLTLFVFSRPKDPLSGSRFAFAVGRHIGQAVRRNRVKRRLREIVRLSLDRLQPGHDCLFVARNAAAAATYSELEEAALQLLARGGLIVSE